MPKPPQLQTLAQVVKYCLSKPGAWLDDPWGGGHQVAKVGPGKGKMFMSAGAVQEEPAFAIRCIDMEDRQFWRDRFPEAIGPQAYMVHVPWNRIVLGKVPDEVVQELIDVSYDQVVSRMPKKDRPEGWVPLTF